jgi:hypothetical protein
VDDVTWTIMALLLTGAGGAATWWMFTRRSTLAGITALGWTLLVPAAWLTGVFALAGRVSTAFSIWVSRLAFSPAFWIGVVLAGVGVSLILVTSLLRRRGLEVAPTPASAVTDSAPTAPLGAPTTRGGRTSRAAGTSRGGDEFDDIEALLRQRGIE